MGHPAAVVDRQRVQRREAAGLAGEWQHHPGRRQPLVGAAGAPFTIKHWEIMRGKT